MAMNRSFLTMQLPCFWPAQYPIYAIVDRISMWYANFIDRTCLVLQRDFETNRSRAAFLRDFAEAVSLTKRLRVNDMHSQFANFSL